MSVYNATETPVKTRRKVHTRQAAEPKLLEVWGDTIKLSHLTSSICIGVACSLGAFFAMGWLLAGHVTSPQMANAYAMLGGLGGSLVAGTICSRLFKPKRVVNESGSDPAAMRAVLDGLVEQHGTLGDLSTLPPATVQELKVLGLYEAFASHPGSITSATTHPR